MYHIWPNSHISASFTRPHPVHTWPPRSHMTTTISSYPFTCDHLVHTTKPRSHMTPFKHDQPVPTTTPWFTCDRFLHMWTHHSHMTTFNHDRLVQMTTLRSHDVATTPFTQGHFKDISPVYTWPGGYGTEKKFRLILSSCHIWTKSIKGFWNNPVNLQHENSKSGVGEGNFRPASSNIPYMNLIHPRVWK